VDEVVIHTDGGCRGNPGPGAYAAVLRCRDQVREVVGTESRTTNNRMELRAAIAGLSALKRPCKVRLVTDSEYLRRGISEWLPGWIQKGWRTSAKKPVLNRDLWEELDELRRLHQVTWDWVRGHAGDPDNERCDRLVNEAMDAMEN
jgi:ribonuclease HI